MGSKLAFIYRGMTFQFDFLKEAPKTWRQRPDLLSLGTQESHRSNQTWCLS